MDPLEIMKRPAAYVSGYENTPAKEQARAKQLCWEYNRTAPNELDKHRAILQQLLGTCTPMTGIVRFIIFNLLLVPSTNPLL